MPTQRKRHLVDRNLQVGLTGSFIAVAVVGLVLQGVLTAHALERLLERTGDPRVVADQLPGLLMRNLTLAAIATAGVMWAFGILLTHRVAGPLYRFERYLEDLAAGELEADCEIRDADELQGICAKLNAAVARLRADSSAASRSARCGRDRDRAA